MPTKPDAQTVAQMAATIASGLAANGNVRTLVPIEFAKTAVGLARAIVAEVERTEPEEPTITDPTTLSQQTKQCAKCKATWTGTNTPDICPVCETHGLTDEEWRVIEWRRVLRAAEPTKEE